MIEKLIDIVGLPWRRVGHWRRLLRLFMVHSSQTLDICCSSQNNDNGQNCHNRFHAIHYFYFLKLKIKLIFLLEPINLTNNHEIILCHTKIYIHTHTQEYRVRDTFTFRAKKKMKNFKQCANGSYIRTHQ